MAAVARILAALRPMRSLQTLQSSLAVPLTRENAARRQCVSLPAPRSYGDSATKYTGKYYDSLVKDKPLVVFMKGEPSAPMCGFSRLVTQILDMHGVKDYEFHDVLEDVDFKEGMKEYSNWPTFPQVYINGELVGGADIMLELHKSGELVSELERIGHRSLLADENSPS